MPTGLSAPLIAFLRLYRGSARAEASPLPIEADRASVERFEAVEGAAGRRQSAGICLGLGE